MRYTLTAAAIVALAGSSALAQSGGWIRDGATVFNLGPAAAITTDTAPRFTNFSTNSPGSTVVTNQLNGHAWFFRRAGSTVATPFNSAAGGATQSGFAATQAAANTNSGLQTQFYGDFRADLSYFVVSTGPDRGLLRMTVTITNLTSNPLTINLFNTIEGGVGSSAPGDSATLSSTNFIRITDATTPWIAGYSGVGASGYQVGTRTSPQDVFSNLGSGSNVNFANTGLPANNTSLTAGYQWQATIDPFFSSSVTATYTIIPAPGAAALLGIGGLIAIRRRR